MAPDTTVDPFSPLPEARVRPVDILACELGFRAKGGKRVAGDSPEANFSKSEIQLAHQIVADTDDIDNHLGIRTVADNEAPSPAIPRSYLILYKTMMFRFIAEGERAARQLSWYKAGFWLVLGIAVAQHFLAR